VKLRLAPALLLLCCPGLAWADDTQYQPFPIGGRALGLGGAFTAIADDASAIHYNPAGIVDAKSPSLDVSTNLYGLQIGATTRGAPSPTRSPTSTRSSPSCRSSPPPPAS
jgi:long-subunit fatty acid transport protein